MSISRAKVLEALTILGVDPKSTDEVIITTGQVVVRKRDVLPIMDDPEPVTTTAHIHE